MEKKNVITGIALDKNVVKLGILKVPDQPGVAAKLFGALARSNISVDMIIQSVHSETLAADMAFTVGKTDGAKAKEIVNRMAKQFKAEGTIYDDEVAKISIVGVGMISQPGVAAKMFEALAQKKINIEMICTSEIRISCVIAAAKGKKAAQILHRKFIV